MTTYQIHKIDTKTGRHQAILISRGPNGSMVPARMDDKGVEICWGAAKTSGARPLFKHPDGRVAMGHYVYVPEEGDEISEKVKSNSILAKCPECTEDVLPTSFLRFSAHESCIMSGERIKEEDWV